MPRRHIGPSSEMLAAQLAHAAKVGRQQEARDPRDPDHTKTGIFVYHNCAYCWDGELPCKQGAPNRCDNPRARND